jgi:hypothetical protein
MSAHDVNSNDEAVSIPSAWDLDWEPLLGNNVPGPVWKPLRRHASGGMTFLTHMPPGWQDDKLVWHNVSEESYKLYGANQLGENHITQGIYLYRPPGILHGPPSCPSPEGSTSLQRSNGEIEILRYDGDEFPHASLQPITDEYRDWPIEWNEHLDTAQLEWVPVKDGRWGGTSVKWLNRHRDTGGGALMLQIPAGWTGEGSGARGPIEEFVIDGAVVIGDDEYGRWGYSYRPAGSAAGSYASTSGATLFCWWDGANELD